MASLISGLFGKKLCLYLSVVPLVAIGSVLCY